LEQNATLLTEFAAEAARLIGHGRRPAGQRVNRAGNRRAGKWLKREA
jgi:hypothetical protein